MKRVGVIGYTNQTASTQIIQTRNPQAFRMEKKSKFNTRQNKMCLSSIPVKIRCAQNERCTSSMCEQSLCKVRIYKGMKSVCGNKFNTRQNKICTKYLAVYMFVCLYV